MNNLSADPVSAPTLEAVPALTPPPVAPNITARLAPLTALAFLFGSRRAILALAAHRFTPLVGLLLVFSASLARNYDGAYLPGEPTVLLHGLAASILNALVFFTAMFVLAARTGVRPSFFRGYLTFLGLFWMTAPMAWLYGIPYERFLTPPQAIEANAWTLGFVALWRVLLISRVLAVLFASPFLRILAVVLIYADILFLAALYLSPAPVVDFMGGMQHSPEDQVLSNIRFLTGFFAVILFPVFGIAALVALAKLKPAWSAPAIDRAAHSPRRALFAAAVAILMWTPALLITQPEQRLRHRAETLLRANRIDEALAEMSRHIRADYPPIWDPPPRMGFGAEAPSLDALRPAILRTDPARWVRDVYVPKSFRRITAGMHSYECTQSVEQFVACIEADEQLRSRLLLAQRAAILDHAAIDPRFTDDLRDRLRRALHASDPNTPTLPSP